MRLVLQVANVSKHYGRVSALSGVSFSIGLTGSGGSGGSSEVLGVIGPNGSGKTTLFDCLGGVLPPDSGAILRDGRPLTPAERIATVFYLPDLVAPWPDHTVRWALDFTRGYWGGTTPIADVVSRLELTPLLDARIGTLSKGQRKRALLGVGLLTPQPVLLADEPFDGLDLRQTREVSRTLRHYATTGRTLLLSIHQIGHAARVCDRFVLLSGGRTCGEGTLAELAALAAMSPDLISHDRAPAAPVDLEEIFLALT